MPEHPRSDKYGWVSEHIKVMSEHLGRPIERGEITHHINMDKTDNRIENLYLCDGHKIHNSIHWTLNKMVKQLIEKEIICFNEGKYELQGG